MGGASTKRRIDWDFLRRFAHDLFIGNDKTCFDCGLRLGTAFKDTAFNQQTVSALPRAAHEDGSPEQSSTHRRYKEWPFEFRNGRYFWRFEEKQYGTSIFQRRVEICRARDEETQKGLTEKRAQRQKSQKPQAGHCHRSFGGAQKGEEGPPQAQALKTSGKFDGFGANVFA
jgi:hypothetical protein